MSTMTQRLSDRYEASASHEQYPNMSDADWIVMKIANRHPHWNTDTVTRSRKYTTRVQINTLRGLLRLCSREHIQLRHGTVKHARDLLRHLEKQR